MAFIFIYLFLAIDLTFNVILLIYEICKAFKERALKDNEKK